MCDRRRTAGQGFVPEQGFTSEWFGRVGRRQLEEVSTQ